MKFVKLIIRLYLIRSRKDDYFIWCDSFEQVKLLEEVYDGRHCL